MPVDRLRLAAAGIALVLGLAACRNVLNDDEESFHTRFVNLIEDSPSVQYLIDTTAVSSAPYRGVTELNAARPGRHTVSFAAIRPASLATDDTTDPIGIGGSFERSYSQDMSYIIFAYGRLDDVRTLVIEAPEDPDDVEEEFIELSILNATADLASVEVFVTAPEARIHSPQSLGTIGVGGRTDVRKLQLFQRDDVTDDEAALFTDLTFELRDPDTGATLFTSAKIRVNEQARILMAITPNIGAGPSPVQLLGLDDAGSVHTSVDDRAAVRLVHASTDTPPLRIMRGSSLNTPLADNVAFRDRSDYAPVPTGDVDLIAQPADEASAVFLFVEEFSAAPGQSYSAYAVGPLAAVDAQVLADNRRSVPTQGSFRFLHAAPSLEDDDGLDIYVTLPGQSIDFDSSDDDDTSDDAGRFVRATAWPYHGVTDYTAYKPSSYRVRFMATGTSRVVLDTTITLDGGSVQTFVLLDSETGDLELMPVDEAF